VEGALRSATAAIKSGAVKALEEITYDAGRHALADQEAFVTGIQQRTGTLLAAHALVASFLGGTVLTSRGLDGWTWMAIGALLVGLVLAAILLAPWDFRFSIAAPDLYDKIFAVASAEGPTDNLSWLVEAAFDYELLRKRNARRARRMGRMSSLLAFLVVVQTLAWLVDLAH
jgi:hypothetical protein